MEIDLTKFVGLAGIPAIENLVNFLVSKGLNKTWAPVAALFVGIVLNLVIAVLLGTPLTTAIGLGLVAGFGASGWHEWQEQQEMRRLTLKK